MSVADANVDSAFDSLSNIVESQRQTIDGLQQSNTILQNENQSLNEKIKELQQELFDFRTNIGRSMSMDTTLSLISLCDSRLVTKIML